MVRLTTARLARRLYLANLAVSLADGRELRANSAALIGEAQVAYRLACRRRDAATAA